VIETVGESDSGLKNCRAWTIFAMDGTPFAFRMKAGNGQAGPDSGSTVHDVQASRRLGEAQRVDPLVHVERVSHRAEPDQVTFAMFAASGVSTK